MRHSFSHKTKDSAILFIPHKSRKTKLKNFSALEREPYVFNVLPASYFLQHLQSLIKLTFLTRGKVLIMCF